ncbi:MAG: DUF1513 domain-containing protein [Pseudomonadota bacterium]
MATRREILGGLAVGLGTLACRRAWAQPAEGAAYVGIETSAATGLSRASFFSATGARLAGVPLDFRAHGLAEAGPLLVVFPRRPGDRFAVVDRATLEIRRVVIAPEGRHFYGHGSFARDGTTLVVPENDLKTLQGALAIYDLSGAPRRLGHVALPGAGPHEIIRVPGRDVFHVALGGLETHPDYGRTPLNLGTFRSEVLTFDHARGEVTPMGHWAGTGGVSLRHLALGADGVLTVGGQVVETDGAARDVLWQVTPRGAEIVESAGALGGYVSSVAASGARVYVTSKKTHRILTLSGGEIIENQGATGASAVAAEGSLHAASGYGELFIGAHRSAALSGHEFDNHGLMLRL